TCALPISKARSAGPISANCRRRSVRRWAGWCAGRPSASRSSSRWSSNCEARQSLAVLGTWYPGTCSRKIPSLGRFTAILSSNAKQDTHPEGVRAETGVPEEEDQHQEAGEPPHTHRPGAGRDADQAEGGAWPPDR